MSTLTEIKVKYCIFDAMSVMERIKAAKTPKALIEVATWIKGIRHKVTPAERAAFEAQKVIVGANADVSFNKVFGRRVGKASEIIAKEK